MEVFDFSGWATKNNLKCSDGRIIMRDAFKHHDGKTVPLVWNHQHNEPLNILGHARLENREEGVYTYCTFNDTENGQNAKKLVQHGDVVALSIYANQLKQQATAQGTNVIHGSIREVSLVLAGANPGAYIDSVIVHGEENLEDGIIYSGDESLMLFHAEEDEETVDESTPETETDSAIAHAQDEETVGDVFDSLSEKQKSVVYAMIGQALEASGSDTPPDQTDTAKHNDEGIEGGNDPMKENIFDKSTPKNKEGNVLSHAEMEAVFNDVKRYGSLRDATIAHGITNIDYLFPDATNLNKTPGMITRNMDWVSRVMNGVHKTPFSRIKSMFANLTADDARAKGYIKGKLKVEEVFGLLKRTTTPTTVYKKQKLDRDDVIDIVDFDVVAWLKTEMRMMLDEELARAILVGDGRLVSSDDKVNEANIRPIWKDDDLYSIKTRVVVSASASEDQKAKAFIRAAIKARKDYKGAGNPVLYTTEDVLTDCLLMEDTTGRVIYETAERLATALRVNAIVTVPVMEGLTRLDGSTTLTLKGIIVNLDDYNVGADKGGAVNMFDDFDIDYNQQKYLIETRISGALVTPYSAIVLEQEETA